MGVTPKIFGLGLKILQSTSMQSKRYWHTEASDQDKNCKNSIKLWPTQYKFSEPSAYFRSGVYAECTLESGSGDEHKDMAK